MIHGVKLTTEGITPQQLRIRLKELGGIPLTEWEEKEIEINPEEEDDELDLDEILREMGFGDDEDEEEFDIEDLDIDELGEYVYKVLSNQELNEGKVMVDGIKFTSLLTSDNILSFIPSTMKDITDIEDKGWDEMDTIKRIITFLRRKFKGLDFNPSYDYNGYGYGVEVDMNSFI